MTNNDRWWQTTRCIQCKSWHHPSHDHLHLKLMHGSSPVTSNTTDQHNTKMMTTMPTMTMTDDSDAKPTTMWRRPQWTTSDDARKSWYYPCHDQPHLNLIFLSVSTQWVLLAPANPWGFSIVMMSCGSCIVSYNFLHYLLNIIPYFTVAIHCHVDTSVYSMLLLINFIVTGRLNPWKFKVIPPNISVIRANVELRYSLMLNCLELDLKFGSKFRKFAEPNCRSSSKFNKIYFSLNLFEPQNFQGWNSCEISQILDLQALIDQAFARIDLINNNTYFRI